MYLETVFFNAEFVDRKFKPENVTCNTKELAVNVL